MGHTIHPLDYYLGGGLRKELSRAGVSSPIIRYCVVRGHRVGGYPDSGSSIPYAR